MENDALKTNIEQYTTDILKTQLPLELEFHNFEHTQELVDAVKKVGEEEKLDSQDLELAETAMRFLLTGYKEDYKDYTKHSKTFAADYLKGQNVSEDHIAKVLDSIDVATGVKSPDTPLEKVVADAYLAASINGDYRAKLGKLRKEIGSITKKEQSEVESIQGYLESILKYEFHTGFGKEQLLPARDKLKSKVEKRLNKLQKEVDQSLSIGLGITSAQLKAMKKKLQKVEGRPERGIETMFRLTSKNHLDLSGMADSKANIMISINSIIMSVVMGSLMSKLDSNEHLYYPTVILLVVNLVSLIFAILSLRPNVSDGLFTREDIENQKTNLLFFGNFHKMKREDYHWGMNKLMENANFLYSNLIDDIYFLGVVLARKYKLLRTSYNIFMYGMVVVVIAYIISLSFVEEPIKDAIINSLQE